MAPLEALARQAGRDAESAETLNEWYGDLGTRELLDVALHDIFPGRIALVSSFGAESAVLLHLLSEVDRNAPVIFLDSGRLFAETLEYRTKLTEFLGLTDVRTITPDTERLRDKDPHRALWMTKPDLCCHIRKTEPLERALSGFDAWITGRKRFQGGKRSALPVFEADGERVKINPLAGWTPDQLRQHAERHGLPAHPLVARGYASIGCVPCTSRVKPGDDQRSGRWRGLAKDECGIHTDFEADGSGI